MSTVTQEQVDAAIKNKYVQTLECLGKRTCIVGVELQNGFTIFETSTCVDPDNYSQEIGEYVCMDKIKDKIWNHLGFTLQNELSKTSFKLT